MAYFKKKKCPVRKAVFPTLRNKNHFCMLKKALKLCEKNSSSKIFLAIVSLSETA
jgi:hypothetical protein